jgi:hypothetical protein
MPIGIPAAVCPCVSVSSLAPTIDRGLSSKCLRRVLALLTFSRHETVGFTDLCFDLWPIRIAAKSQRGKSMQKLLGALTAAALFIAAYNNAVAFPVAVLKAAPGRDIVPAAEGCGPRGYRGPGGACHRFGHGPYPGGYWGPIREMAAHPALGVAVGSLPQHAVPRKASGRIMVLGRAGNDP